MPVTRLGFLNKQNHTMQSVHGLNFTEAVSGVTNERYWRLESGMLQATLFACNEQNIVSPIHQTKSI